VPIFAAWVAYQLTVQLNFSALAAAFPFWIFAAAALHLFEAVEARPVFGATTRVVPAVAWVLLAVAAVLGAASTVFPYLADTHLLQAVNADYGRRVDLARSEAALAAAYGPRESVYAVEVGNVSFERGDWNAARLAYQEAARLGTYNPIVYRNLAMADRNLSLKAEAIAAARQAVELDRFDPANQDLLAELVATGP
jgi:tetratricopeptide (TPR) repeat protein